MFFNRKKSLKVNESVIFGEKEPLKQIENKRAIFMSKERCILCQMQFDIWVF